MSQDCIDIGTIQDFAAKDANRIVGNIGKVLVRKSPWINVLTGGTIPNVSDVVRSVVQEPAVMATSLAEPEFVDDVTLCGAQADDDEVGETEYQYGLQSRRGQGPKVCVKTSRTAFKGAYLQAEIALEKGILQIINADVRAVLTRRSGVKFVARKGVTFDNLITGDVQNIDEGFSPYLPTAPMNFKTLYKLATLAREEFLTEPFGTETGDYFMVMASIDQTEVFRNDADVKEDLIALTTGSFKIGEDAIAGYSFKGYRGLGFGIDSQPLRYNELDGNGQPIFIEPVIGKQVSKGKGARRNPAWVAARYELGHLIGANSFQRQTPEKYSGEGTFKFAPQMAMGELQFLSIQDNGCNKYQDFGYHIYQISRAMRPMRPHAVIPFAYERCTFDTGLNNCITPSTGL